MAAKVTTKQAEPETIEAEKPASISASVYIGPSIRGYIQTLTIYPASKEQAPELPELAFALEKYPGIADLVVPVEGLLEARQDMNTSGTALNKALAALKEAVQKK
jgi:hypothetical protein